MGSQADLLMSFGDNPGSQRRQHPHGTTPTLDRITETSDAGALRQRNREASEWPTTPTKIST